MVNVVAAKTGPHGVHHPPEFDAALKQPSETFGRHRLHILRTLEENPPERLIYSTSNDEAKSFTPEELAIIGRAESRLDHAVRPIPNEHEYFLGVRKSVFATLKANHMWFEDGLGGLRERMMPYHVVFDSNKIHPESVIQYSVLEGRRRIATFGFYAKAAQDRIELHISNIQGSSGLSDGEESPLTTLSARLGENWRVHIARSLREFGERNGMNVVGDLIERDRTRASPGEYKRQLRQYKNTYKRAGITEIDASMVSEIDREDYDYKIWQEIEARKNDPPRAAVKKIAYIASKPTT